MMLLSLRERATQGGNTPEVESAPGEGTHVVKCPPRLPRTARPARPAATWSLSLTVGRAHLSEHRRDEFGDGRVDGHRAL
jgi:hypothetical protein